MSHSQLLERRALAEVDIQADWVAVVSPRERALGAKANLEGALTEMQNTLFGSSTGSTTFADEDMRPLDDMDEELRRIAAQHWSA